MERFLTAAGACACLLVLATSPLVAQEQGLAGEILVFDAVASGKAEVRVVPRDAHQVTLLIRNTPSGVIDVPFTQISFNTEFTNKSSPSSLTPGQLNRKSCLSLGILARSPIPSFVKPWQPNR